MLRQFWNNLHNEFPKFLYSQKTFFQPFMFVFLAIELGGVHIALFEKNVSTDDCFYCYEQPRLIQ